MIFMEQQGNFSPAYSVSAVYCFHEERMLIVRRAHDKKFEPDKWGVPAGKLESGEDRFMCAIREMKEETGIVLEKERLIFVKEVFVVWDNVHFTFNIFKYSFDTLPEVALNTENTEFKWVTYGELGEFDLVRDERECIIFAHEN
jgi:8-oxo-dGTP pyrophosphatase MutT (NUDIX family)